MLIDRKGITSLFLLLCVNVCDTLQLKKGLRFFNLCEI